MQHLQLSDLRLVEVACLCDSRLLRVGDWRVRDAGIGILLGQTLHGQLERRLQRFLVRHSSFPFLTQVLAPTVTVRSVKKFQRTYAGRPAGAATAPPSSVLSPSDRRTTPAP